KRQREERRERHPSHRGDVTEAASQASMPHRVCRMPFPPKVHLLETEIGCDQHLLPARQLQNRAIVADTLPASGAPSRQPANALDEQFLAKRHSEPSSTKAVPAAQYTRRGRTN